MRQDARGFTLLELMVTLAVLVVVLGVAMPAFASLHRRTVAATAYHQLTASLMLARATAISRRHPVTMCPSDDGRHCRDDPSWEHGWIIFDDPARAGEPASDEAVLRYVEGVGGTLQVSSSRGRTRVRYHPNGLAHGSNLSLQVCGPDGQLGKVVVSNTGRARTERTPARPPCDAGPADA